MGLTMDQTQDMPVGQLQDLIACEQIKYEGWEACPPPCNRPLTEEEEAEEFFEQLERR